MKWLKLGSVALVLFAVSACESFENITDLEVENLNAPDRERALAEAGDVENLIGGSFLTFFQSTQWCAPSWTLSTAADEGTMSWGNFAMKDISSEPRVAFQNNQSYGYAYAIRDPWFGLYEVTSNVFDGLLSLEDEAISAGLTAEELARARAFGKFLQGVAHGWIALMFDSGFVFDETVDIETATDSLALQPYTVVMDSAISYFNQALNLMASGSDFTLENTWLKGNDVTRDDLVRITHSFMARYLSQVGRTPTERAAADWNAILSHINNGITSDLEFELDGSVFSGGTPWDDCLKNMGNLTVDVTGDRTWGRADYKTIGPADTSGNYAAWLTLNAADRNEFLIETADARITAAGDPQDHGTDYEYKGPSRFRPERGTYHFSFYGHRRYEPLVANSMVGFSPFITVTEMDLLEAEARIRLGQGGAAALINNTRVTRGGLTAATDADADLFEKMVYEKRIETMYLCGGCAYFDRRGLGPLSDSRGNPVGTNHLGLVEGTPVHMPIPARELETLNLPLYTYGGVGNEGVPTTAPPVGEFLSTTVPAHVVYEMGRKWRQQQGITDDRQMSSGLIQLTRY